MFTIRVPATTANLGPGFDCLGLALNLYNEFQVRVTEGFEVRVTVEGWGAEELKKPENNLFVRACREVFLRHGQVMPGLDIRCWNRIPGGSGLGSSAAALVAGLVAGNELLSGSLSQQELLEIATEMEGHPDNVVPALLGGFVVAVKTEEQLEWLKWDVPETELAAVAVIPRYLLATRVSRQVLPRKVAFADAVFNVSRVALLTGAIARRDWSKLGAAMADRLHQPYRVPLIPGLNEALAAARSAGAWGAALSGAGPTILAITDPAGAPAVASAVMTTLQARGIKADALVLHPDNKGISIEK